ncbi:dTDP-glucose 4,6-dehydratase [Orenia marismortui]|uniref:dTDP-glucose 4,6-dehydratase n=1 Tax=Orenia marismortui TaxID=46469 RepID=UPI00058D1917|nr:dTDP-glucose 4,6-dehydratase [Orenia marismortui]
MKTYLVTGGAGFIGSNFVKYLLEKYNNINVIVLDKLTYAGNLITLKDVIDKIDFIKGDIANKELVEYIFNNYVIDYVINFAAESHVDRSINNSQIFLETNVLGTQNLLEIAKNRWQVKEQVYIDKVKFVQVSTDEVYGSLENEGYFTEETSLSPRSPYAASKASADLIVKSYVDTYKFPAIISRCSNNYGPKQYPEKLIPVIIQNIVEGKKIPVYGDGKNIRDWIYVEDHVKAIDRIIKKGRNGEVYNIGSNNERENIELVKFIIDSLKKIINENQDYKDVLKVDISNINYNLIKFVKDRLGHDKRYAINSTKIQQEVNWKPNIDYEVGIEKTIRWYLENQDWIKQVRSNS